MISERLRFQNFYSNSSSKIDTVNYNVMQSSYRIIDNVKVGHYILCISIVSSFNIMKTLTLLVHAGLFCCFHNPPNSDGNVHFYF